MPMNCTSETLQLGAKMERAALAIEEKFSSIKAFCKQYREEMYAQLLKIVQESVSRFPANDRSGTSLHAIY